MASKNDFVSEIVAERTKRNPAFPALVKKASGRNVKEAERNTVAVKLRVRPETAAEVRRLATEWDCPASYVVEAMMYIAGRALAGKPMPEDGFEEVLTSLYQRDEA